MLVVSDTGPIISLAVLRRLDLLDVLFDGVVIPEAVWRELEPRIAKFDISQAIQYCNRVVAVTQPFTPPNPIPPYLGPGETEAIRLCKETNADQMLVEDKGARRYAESLGISCIGTPGVLDRAKHKGIIPEIRPLFVELLARRRFFALHLLNGILAANNEAPL